MQSAKLFCGKLLNANYHFTNYSDCYWFLSKQRNSNLQSIGIFKDGKIEGEKTMEKQRKKRRHGVGISSRLNEFI